ncbi:MULTISPECIES: hypothetical protein [Nocardia]|nr:MULTISPECIES: hypothetical protein [Nocardia]
MRPDIARYVFLDLCAYDFFADRDVVGNATGALPCAEAARDATNRPRTTS